MESFKAHLTLLFIVLIILAVCYILFCKVAKAGEYHSLVAGLSSWVSNMPGHKPVKGGGKKSFVATSPLKRPVPGGKTPGAALKQSGNNYISQTKMWCLYELWELDSADLSKVLSKKDIPFQGRGGVLVGVGTDCNVKLEKTTHPYVSKDHAKLYLKAGKLLVKDYNSTNGIYNQDLEPMDYIDVSNEEVFYLSPENAFCIKRKNP